MPPPDSIITDRLAVEIARIGMESSDVQTLQRITDLAARAVTGCAGATSVRWSAGETPEPVLWAASHPDLAELIDLQLASGDGPIYEVVNSGESVTCDDTLVETRWPTYSPAMLCRGVRCFTTALHDSGEVLVTLTMYGVLPGALNHQQLALASLLVAQGGAAVSNTLQFDEANRTATQLQEAVEARAVVDQAKGIIMHALGCDADQAFAELRRVSQTSHVKLTAVAQRIVTGQGLTSIGSPGRQGRA